MTTGHRRTRWSALAVIGLLLLSTVSAGAAPSDQDLREERERLRAEQALVASQIDVTEADAAAIAAALADIHANVELQTAQHEQAVRAVEAAEAEVASALAAQAATEAEVTDLRAQMAQLAVNAYVSPPQSDTLKVMLEGDLGNAPERQVLLDIRTADTSDVLERLRSAQEDLAIQAETARLAEERAEQGRADVEAQLAELEGARTVQDQLADAAQVRLDAMLHEAAEIESAGAEIDSELSRREEQRRREEEERRRKAAEEERARLQRQISDAEARRGEVRLPSGGSINLVRVGGIVVDASIAGNLQRMLDAAAASGLTLTGGGYRDSSAQIALRRAHCGTSDYAIYQMPSGQCSPPTAIPGTSNHEKGLAIDFSHCSSRSTACYQWLAANASGFGFRNLPSEPWHWSVDGQ